MKVHKPLMTVVLTAALLAGCGADPSRADVPVATASAPVTMASAPLPGPSTSGPAESPAGPTQGMPEMTGERLSDAEVLLRSAGFMAVTSVDVTGQGRTPLEKNNWVVERQSPEAGAAVRPGVTVTLGVRKPSDGLPAPQVVKGVVPKVVCLNLQSAQEAMRGAGFYLLLAQDGLGQRRYPLVDRNWVVVGQSAAPGSTVDKTAKIELTVVKYGEPTGNSECRS
jgi:beta-lactam-binding protein with PASTA domain